MRSRIAVARPFRWRLIACVASDAGADADTVARVRAADFDVARPAGLLDAFGFALAFAFAAAPAPWPRVPGPAAGDLRVLANLEKSL